MNEGGKGAVIRQVHCYRPSLRNTSIRTSIPFDHIKYVGNQTQWNHSAVAYKSHHLTFCQLSERLIVLQQTDTLESLWKYRCISGRSCRAMSGHQSPERDPGIGS